MSSSSSELQPYITPQKSFTTPAPVTAYRQQGISVCFYSVSHVHAVFVLLDVSSSFLIFASVVFSSYMLTCCAVIISNVSDVAASYLLGSLYGSKLRVTLSEVVSYHGICAP